VPTFWKKSPDLQYHKIGQKREWEEKKTILFNIQENNSYNV
jgi:hypothetical protein